jgi:putative ATP-dependent endonuclease of OLD family
VYLDLIKLERFRSCADCTIKFRSDLTVLVGENNGGKSNIIDALRLLTLPLNGRRDRYPEDDDVRKGSPDPDFRIEGRFTGLSDTLKGLLIGAVPDPTADLAILGMRYQAKSGGSLRGKTSFWAGRFDMAEPEPGSTDLIRHVYLPPLRDAQQALGSASATRITALLQHFLQDGEEQSFLQHVRRNPDPHRVVSAINTEIGSALGSLTSGVRAQAALLDFASETLLDVARDLRFRLADAGFDPEDIRSSGLGYANLLYMATVAIELAKAREADLTLFLVEEPEAHLHPQLQMVVLDFLLDQAIKSAEQISQSGQPEGRVQVTVTTHSPNLTAWVSPKHLVVIRSVRDETSNPPTQKTASISIAELALRPASFNKVSRYLDVTRSALLFGNRAILVEGIAEALLLPVIARCVVLKDDSQAWQRFRGAVLVPIDGVDFKPYVEILLRPHDGTRIADRIGVITDADPNVLGNRKADLEALAQSLDAASNLRVFTNQRTLEHELFAAGNEKLLKQSFLAIHRNSRGDWERCVEAISEVQRATEFLKLLSNKRTRKGDLAQEIAMRIAKGAPFAVPDYLRDAINAVAQL